VEATLAVISPYVAHRIASDDRDIMVVLIEPETVERQTLPSYLASAGVVADVQLRQHFRNVQARLQVNTGELRADDADFDEVVFGSALPRAALDERIAHALELLGDDQRRDMTAEMLAQHASLSFSRFLHLFKEEVGAPLRTFRSWKRARSLLPYVTQDAKLTDIAQETGYPDAAHFSNSIRNVFGLQPREVFAGSRRLVLYGQGTPTAPPRRRPA
jgi:transcriptional regulator GlxA family with amidase domain